MKTLALLWALLWSFALAASACDDDGWRKLADCAGGRMAARTNTELICYEPDGGPYASRAVRSDESASTACEFCEGFIQSNGGTR